MTTERIVVTTKNVRLGGVKCAHAWSIIEYTEIPPLIALSLFESDLEKHGWVYNCTTHGQFFKVSAICPLQNRGHFIESGTTISLPSSQAEELVQKNLAYYPTNVVDEAETPTGTLAKLNSLLEHEGLPKVDSESMRTISVKGKRNHYGSRSGPSDAALADDLGISPDDIADMKSWGSSKK